MLGNSPNVVSLLEYFWSEDEDAVLVLEFLKTDLASVINEAKRDWEGGLRIGEIKRWMIQILHGVDACHRNSIVHRDLKPSNLLISDDGVLKLADFGQARVLLEPGFVAADETSRPDEQNTPNVSISFQQSQAIPDTDNSGHEVSRNQDQRSTGKEECLKEVDELKSKDSLDETDKETSIHDGDTSCLATCTASDIEDDPFKSEADEGGDERYGPLTSCAGTRWFRAPELLYGSTNYGLEIDLWSLGCIFAELLSLKPLFPGTSDIDQISKIFKVLGSMNMEAWPGCVKLPDYSKITFGTVDPIGLESCLPDRSCDEILLVKKLICFDPASRATAMELLHDKYFNEEPLPVPISELRVPSTNCGQDEGSHEYQDMDSDSDFEGFANVDVTATDSGFSMRFP